MRKGDNITFVKTKNTWQCMLHYSSNYFIHSTTSPQVRFAGYSAKSTTISLEVWSKIEACITDDLRSLSRRDHTRFEKR